MKQIKKILISVVVLEMLILPAVSLAQTEDGLVHCGKPVTTATTVGTLTYSPGQVIPCNFGDFLKLINDIITFILVDLSLPIAAIMFTYAGFLMVSSGGSTESRGKAKTIFTNTALGLIFVAGAWLIVKTLLTATGFTGAAIITG